MSQVSYGTITINDLTDITDVYLEYALVSDTITRAEDIPSSTQWSTTYPTWVSGQQIWIRRVTRKEGIDEPEYGTPYLDTAVNQINNQTQDIDIRTKYMWWNLNSRTNGQSYDGIPWTKPDYPAGTYLAEGRGNNSTFDKENSDTYGYNTFLTAGGLSLRYNAFDLISFDNNGININSPVENNGVIVDTNKGIELTSNGLSIIKGGELISSFSDSIVLGKNNESHIKMDYHSLQMIDKEGNSYLWVSDLRDHTGYADVVDTFRGDGIQLGYILTVGPAHTPIPVVTINGNLQTNNIEIYSDHSWGEIHLYDQTTDVEIIAGKKYYKRVDTTPSIWNNFDWVQSPVVEDLSLYYEEVPLTKDDVLVVSYKSDSYMTKAFTFGYRKASSNIGAGSFCAGWECEASGGSSHAEGNFTTASAYASHAEGGNTIANNYYSHAEGGFTTASGLASHAEGSHTIASGLYSHAEGIGGIAHGEHSHAEGSYTDAGGQNSHAEGESTTASDGSCHAEGSRTLADNFCAHAEGYYTIANAMASHAEGSETTASGLASHTEGSGTLAEGVYSHAEGEQTSAIGINSHTQNKGTKTNYSEQTAIGRYNNNRFDTAFEIGNGSDNDNRSNALVVDWFGNVDITGSYKVNGMALSALDVGAVPTTRKINNKTLSSNISLTASDVGAVPTSRTINNKALSADISLNASDVDAVPTTRTVNNKALSEDISLSASDVGAVPTTRTVNGNPLSSNVADADYVTAQGTSGAWKYRKWNSGKVEAWAYISFTSTTPAVWVSPIRYIDKTFTIPSGIFASAPRMTGSSNSNQYWAVDLFASSSTAGSVRFCTVASSALTPYIQIYAWTN